MAAAAIYDFMERYTSALELGYNLQSVSNHQPFVMTIFEAYP